MQYHHCAVVCKYTPFYTISQVFFYLRYSNLEFTAASGNLSAHSRPVGCTPRIELAAGTVTLYAWSMAPARVTNKRTAAANCAALRVFVHINFLGKSNRRRRSAAFLDIVSVEHARPTSRRGRPRFVVCGVWTGPPYVVARPFAAPVRGTAGKLRFLPWIGGVSWPPAGPQPAPYPQKSREPLGVRPVSHAHRFPVFVWVRAVPPWRVQSGLFGLRRSFSGRSSRQCLA